MYNLNKNKAINYHTPHKTWQNVGYVKWKHALEFVLENKTNDMVASINKPESIGPGKPKRLASNPRLPT